MNAGFETFGPAHLASVAITLAVAVLVPLAVRGARSERVERRARRVLVLCLVAYLVVGPTMRAVGYGFPWQEHLPLHLCGASIVLGAIMLGRGSYALYEVVYFWGTGGVVAALATPDLTVGFPHPLYWLFFVGHGLAVMAVMYATLVMGFRPRWRSVGIALAVTALYAALIFPLNFAIGTNYLYLLHKPTQPTPLDLFGPWPWYILPLGAVAAVVMFICYAPFAARDLAAAPRRPS